MHYINIMMIKIIQDHNAKIFYDLIFIFIIIYLLDNI